MGRGGGGNNQGGGGNHFDRRQSNFGSDNNMHSHGGPMNKKPKVGGHMMGGGPDVSSHYVAHAMSCTKMLMQLKTSINID
jgi:hypothetical protein